MRVQIAVNAQGRRIGEDHQRAVLTNAEVEQLLALRDEGYSYQRLAAMFEVSKSAVRNYCKGLRRGQSVARYKVVHVTG